ncbi:T9SS type A sorting domain-containing protein [Aequorivita sublithincola]|uniref:T9SS type A sorting domain-containing protein n=1 Tax=Aequorivita sublithincola TaxID=101385 RepID=UPI0003010118
MQHIECYNIDGKLIFSEVFEESNKEFNISNSNSGLYILKLSSSKETYYQKLVKE